MNNTIKLLRDFIITETQIVHAANSKRGVSKALSKEEHKLLTQIVSAMHPSATKEDIKNIVDIVIKESS